MWCRITTYLDLQLTTTHSFAHDKKKKKTCLFDCRFIFSTFNVSGKTISPLIRFIL